MCNTKGEGMGKVQSNISRKDKIILNKRKNNCNILIIRLYSVLLESRKASRYLEIAFSNIFEKKVKTDIGL